MQRYGLCFMNAVELQHSGWLCWFKYADCASSGWTALLTQFIRSSICKCTRARITVYSRQYTHPFAYRKTNARKLTRAIILYELRIRNMFRHVETRICIFPPICCDESGYCQKTCELNVERRTFVVDIGRFKESREVSRISYGTNLDSWSKIAVSHFKHFMTFL